MPAKGKGKRKVTAGPMDPRKTREPVTGHPDTDLNAALNDILLSPPHPHTGYASDASIDIDTTPISFGSEAAAAPPPPTPAANLVAAWRNTLPPPQPARASPSFTPRETPPPSTDYALKGAFLTIMSHLNKQCTPSTRDRALWHMKELITSLGTSPVSIMGRLAVG